MFRRLALGVATGIVAGYGLVRLCEALRDVRTPAPAITTPDPAAYARIRRGLMIAGIARSTASLAATAFVFADPLQRSLQGLPRFVRTPVFAGALMLLGSARDWPVEYVEGFRLERIHGTSEQSGPAWAQDQLKALAIGLVVTTVMTACADAIVMRAPRTWPWFAIGATPVLLALANVIAPVYIMPVFNKYVPLEGPLEAKIRALSARYGAGNASILRFDMSRQTKKANAFVTGVFGTERIVLADTLIDNFEEDEILFVVAHELGHYVRRDPWVSIALGTAFLAVMILKANSALHASMRRLDSAANGARFAFYASLVAMAGAPLMSAASRAIERRADRFAIAATGDPRSGARAFRRLRDQNLAEDEGPKWAEILFSSHPSLKSRIARLEASAHD
jgi:STE24 endopeptidase